MSNLIKIIIFSFLSSFVLLYYFFYSSQNTNFDDFALSSTTTTILEKYNGRSINYINFDINESDITELENKNLIISFGNSQSHSINEYNISEEHLFVYILNHLNRDKIILNLSSPNANLQEMFLSIVNVRKKLGKQFDTAIVSLVFDDTREDGIRDSLKTIVEKNKITLSQYSTFMNILESFEKDKKEQEISKSSLLLKDKVENIINTYLNNTFESYVNRGNIRSFFYGELYYLRNWILGIKPTTKRKKIQRIYEKNIQALKDIVNFTKQNNIQLILYIAPIRKDILIPYLASEYLQFKEDITKIHKVYDLDDIVPHQYWGMTNGDWVDFMHFKGEGHKILANELQKIIIEEKANK